MNMSPLSGLMASASGQDLAGMVHKEEPAHEHLMAKLPKIEEELNVMLSELQGALTEPAGAAALIGSPPDSARTGLRTAVELLQEQSKMWFRQVARITEEVAHLDADDRRRFETIGSTCPA